MDHKKDEKKEPQHFPAPGGCIPGHGGDCRHPVYMSEPDWLKFRANPRKVFPPNPHKIAVKK